MGVGGELMNCRLDLLGLAVHEHGLFGAFGLFGVGFAMAWSGA
jgi:hypothetical protein